MVAFKWALLSVFSVAVQAGTIVWDGSFSNFATAADFDKWSWANQVGPYQWYIHGSSATSHYLALDSSYKNPAITKEARGLKMTIDSGATWNSQMERAELIPQTTANLGTGQMYYHFSLKRSATNPPDSTLEHQIAFFESHFTELKYGVGSNPTNLVWMIGGQEKWSTAFTPDIWYNFAYDINFSSGTVGLWGSTGGSPLQRLVANQKASTSTNSADFHVGVLRIVNRNPPEDWYWSGVYIESGSLTTAIGSGSSPNPSTPGTTPPPATTPPPVTTSEPVATPPPATTSPSAPLQTQYGQCGGTNWTGPTECVPPAVCKAVSAPYYSQCQ